MKVYQLPHWNLGEGGQSQYDFCFAVKNINDKEYSTVRNPILSVDSNRDLFIIEVDNPIED